MALVQTTETERDPSLHPNCILKVSLYFLAYNTRELRSPTTQAPGKAKSKKKKNEDLLQDLLSTHRETIYTP